ncbi:hypothetical protein MLD38_022202 [Melastoma candidum]|uniref:Uncharacterized protein n=1 Tax=Melastoma candidum TaxID=119954 RepID=A0ACB9QHU4_9MYRT|nr:hypothetical protein MLD38_022202 [Melastoma candidum]
MVGSSCKILVDNKGKDGGTFTCTLEEVASTRKECSLISSHRSNSTTSLERTERKASSSSSSLIPLHLTLGGSAMSRLPLLVTLVSLLLPSCLIPGARSTTFTLVNKCDRTVWPGILSNAGSPPFPTTGFTLPPGSSKSLVAPSAWGGRFWARTYCTSSASFSCLTGDCSSGTVDCSGKTASPPATLVEFTLDGSGGLDFFDVSLVDGYNLPILVTPQGGSGQNCTATGCIVDLNGSCPSDLRVTSSEGEGAGGAVVACRSACEAYGNPEYCCSGEYSSPATCKPSSYSEVFKNACPKAYSYAYDDQTSTFTCTSGADYVITFCPSPNTSQKSASSDQQTPPSLFSNSTMIYTGVQDTSGSSEALSPGLVAVTMTGAAAASLLLRRRLL